MQTAPRPLQCEQAQVCRWMTLGRRLAAVRRAGMVLTYTLRRKGRFGPDTPDIWLFPNGLRVVFGADIFVAFVGADGPTLAFCLDPRPDLSRALVGSDFATRNAYGILGLSGVSGLFGRLFAGRYLFPRPLAWRTVCPSSLVGGTILPRSR